MPRSASGTETQVTGSSTDGIHDVLGPILEGVDLGIKGLGGAARREVVAVDGFADEAVRIWGTSQDSDPAGSGQANSGSAVP